MNEMELVSIIICNLAEAGIDRIDYNDNNNKNTMYAILSSIKMWAKKLEKKAEALGDAGDV